MFHFDGIDDYVFVFDNPSIIMSTQMTIEVCVNHPTFSTGIDVVFIKEVKQKLKTMSLKLVSIKTKKEITP